MKTRFFLAFFLFFTNFSIYSLDYSLRSPFRRHDSLFNKYVSKDFFEEKVYNASPVSVGLLSGLLTNNGKSICLMHYLFAFLLTSKAANDDSLSIPAGYCLGLLIGQAGRQTIKDMFDRIKQFIFCSKSQVVTNQNEGMKK